MRTCFSESVSCFEAGATAGVSSFRLYSGLSCFRRASGLRLLNRGGVEGLLRPRYLLGGESERLFLLLSLGGDLLRSLDGDRLLRCGEPELPRPRRGGGDGEPAHTQEIGSSKIWSKDYGHLEECHWVLWLVPLASGKECALVLTPPFLLLVYYTCCKKT